MAVEVILREGDSQATFTAENKAEAEKLFHLAWNTLPTEVAKVDARIAPARRLLGAQTGV